MITVLIAEDEYLVRVGLRTCIDWEANGYQLLDDAVDGTDAYQKIQQYHPDILLLDIKMPRLDGLGLLEKLRSEGNGINVIILSCLDDFEHVRAALQYDVIDYMNKLTITPAELLKVLSKITISASWDKESAASKPTSAIAPWSALKKILRGQTCDDSEKKQIYERGRLLVIAAAPRADGSTIAPHLFMTITSQQLKSNGIENIISYDESNSVVILLPAASDALAIASTLLRQLKITLDTDCAIGISPSYKAIEELYGAFCCAMQIEEFTYWLNEGSIVDYAALQERESSHTEEFLLRKVRTAISAENLSVVVDSIHEAGERFRNNPGTSKERYCQLLLAILDLIPKKELTDPFYSTQTEILRSSTYKDAQLALTEYISFCYKKAGFTGNDYSSIISRTISFIAENPGEIITLSKAARAVNVSESYLSQLFKKETGKNFNTYIHHLKINQAKELLEEGLLIYEVCDRIGFDNANYFAKLFRRYTGISPNEYKKRSRKPAKQASQANQHESNPDV